jgi:hypothetical protein
MRLATRVSDEELLAASCKYRVRPESLKALAYVLFDRNMNRAEVRFVLKKNKGVDTRTLAATLRAYHATWQAQQNGSRTTDESRLTTPGKWLKAPATPPATLPKRR